MTKNQLKETFDDQSAGGAVIGALVRALNTGPVKPGAVYDRASGAFSVRISHVIAGDLVELSPNNLKAAQEFLSNSPRTDDTGRALKNLLNEAARSLSFAQDYVAGKTPAGRRLYNPRADHLRLAH